MEERHLLIESASAAQARRAPRVLSRPSDFEIRALNPENRPEVQRLIDLYRGCYGDQYPFKRVYREAYWASQGGALFQGQKFLNLVALQDRQFIGHLGLRVEDRSGSAEIISLAVDMSRRRNIFAATRHTWQKLEALAQRQQWQSLFFFCPLTHPALQILSSKCLHSTELALLPEYLRGLGPSWSGWRNSSQKTDVLIMHNTLRPNHGPWRRLYPPERHRAVIAWLYAPLNLKREFCRESGAAAMGGRSSAAAGRDAPAGVEVEARRRFGVCHVTLRPSLMTGGLQTKTYLEGLGHDGGKRPYIQVRLEDPACPPACTLLEELGYHFCGIRPSCEGHDYVLYARFDPLLARHSTLYSPRARALAEYIQKAGLH